jgi:hypothetical protein
MMSERRFGTLEEANVFARLMRSVSGQEMCVSRDGKGWIVHGAQRSWSIVDVTEELLRQVGK